MLGFQDRNLGFNARCLTTEIVNFNAWRRFMSPLLLWRNMINFYDVKPEYIDFLKKYDRQIPNITYSGNNKFMCGIVLTINGHNYYAPISNTSQKDKYCVCRRLPRRFCKAWI